MQKDGSPRGPFVLSWYLVICVGGLMGVVITAYIPMDSVFARLDWGPRHVMAGIAQIVFGYAMVNWSHRTTSRTLAFLLPGVVNAVAQHGKPFSPTFAAGQVGIWVVCVAIFYWQFRRRMRAAM